MRVWLRQFSFRTRMSALVAAAVGVAVALAAISSYLIVAHQLSGQVNTSLQKDANSLQASARQFGSYAVYSGRALNIITVQDQDVLQFIDANGQILPPAPSVHLPVGRADRQVAQAAPSGSTAQVFDNATVHGTRYRVLTTGVGASPSSGIGEAIQIAHRLTQTERTLAALRLVLFVVALAGVALAVGLGLLVAGATIRPVKRLTAAAEHVAATQDLDARIDEEGDDELARLGRAFNDMLATLATSRKQQAQLVSDAGHELRTPLTSLRTNIEVLMRVRELPEADRADLLGDVRAQLEELTTLIGDVVELARQDEQQSDPTEIRFDELVGRAVERARRRAPSLGFDLRLDIGNVRAQPALLERAVLNVLDNAVKFSPPGATIEVQLRREDRWNLDVRDHGPGISPEDLPRIFDRFFRAPSARALPGSGLGLAIVRQVVTAHGGTVAAYLPPDGGTVVHVELPTVTEQEPEAGALPPEPDWASALSADR